jgi:hypothetical protein
MTIWGKLQQDYAANMWKEALNKRLGTKVCFNLFVCTSVYVFLSAVRESTVFVRTFFLNLYLNEVEGLGPVPHLRGAAIITPHRRGQGHPNNGGMPNQTKPAYPLVLLLLIYVGWQQSEK